MPPGEIPKDAAALTTTFVLTSVEDANWFVEGADRDSEAVLVESSVVRARATSVWLDANGTPIKTQKDEGDGETIVVLNLGPVLTLDWDCHRQTWLGGWKLPDRPSVEERTLSSGSTAVVFSVTQVLELPNQDEDDEISLVRSHGTTTHRQNSAKRVPHTGHVAGRALRQHAPPGNRVGEDRYR